MPAATGQHRLLIGALVSVLVHLGAIAALGSSFRTLLAPDPAPADAAEELQRTPLGLERSKAKTIDWVGYDTYREHVAREAETDQAAMAIGAVVAGAPDATGDTPTDRAPAEVTPLDTLAAPPLVMKPVTQDTRAAAPLVLDAPPTPAEVPVAPEKAREPEAAKPQEQRPRQETQQPAQPATPREGAPSDDPTIVQPGNADKESVPTSRRKAIDWRLGQPLAAEGLEIKTVRPRWSIRTSIMSAPQSPLLRIHFRKSGKVARVEVLEGSGYEDVDRPLVDAVFYWKAQGEALKALPSDDEQTTIPITIRIRLR